MSVSEVPLLVLPVLPCLVPQTQRLNWQKMRLTILPPATKLPRKKQKERKLPDGAQKKMKLLRKTADQYYSYLPTPM